MSVYNKPSLFNAHAWTDHVCPYLHEGEAALFKPSERIDTERRPGAMRMTCASLAFSTGGLSALFSSASCRWMWNTLGVSPPTLAEQYQFSRSQRWAGRETRLSHTKRLNLSSRCCGKGFPGLSEAHVK